MATPFQFEDKKSGEIKNGIAYTMQEKGAYHTMRAKKGSINPETNQPFTATQRARSRGWLSHNKQSNNAFNYHHPEYKKK